MCSCSPCKCWAIPRLLCSFPKLISWQSFWRPAKTLAFLDKCDMDDLAAFAACAPPEQLTPAFGALLEGLPMHKLAQLPALLSEEATRKAVAQLLPVLHPEDLVLLTREVPLEIILLAPANSLVAVVAGLERHRFAEVVLPMLQRDLEATVLPLLHLCQHPTRLAKLLNIAPPLLIPAALQALDAVSLSAFVDALEHEDLEAGGRAQQLLELLEHEQSLLGKVALLFKEGNMVKIVRFMRSVPPPMQLRMLRSQSVESLVTLTSYTDASLVARLADMEAASSNDELLSFTSSALATAMRNEEVALAVQQITEVLGTSISSTERAFVQFWEAADEVKDLLSQQVGNWSGKLSAALEESEDASEGASLIAPALVQVDEHAWAAHTPGRSSVDTLEVDAGNAQSFEDLRQGLLRGFLSAGSQESRMAPQSTRLEDLHAMLLAAFGRRSDEPISIAEPNSG